MICCVSVLVVYLCVFCFWSVVCLFCVCVDSWVFVVYMLVVFCLVHEVASVITRMCFFVGCVGHASCLSPLFPVLFCFSVCCVCICSFSFFVIILLLCVLSFIVVLISFFLLWWPLDLPVFFSTSHFLYPLPFYRLPLLFLVSRLFLTASL